ncbi:hydroxymethylbilane synthase, partial [Francisella tularensis subsp. holarctica]|nr:hydroxymethylbilane synthase [Francisella tularensis subsp. holarctica]
VKNRIKSELNFPCEICTMNRHGDIILDQPLNKIGGKALFMIELEVAMLSNKADIAVHSLKDVPYLLPQGFCLAGFMPREDPRDSFVSIKYNS